MEALEADKVSLPPHILWYFSTSYGSFPYFLLNYHNFLLKGFALAGISRMLFRCP